VSIAVGEAELTDCPAFDQNDNRQVDINELVAAVDNALNGCDRALREHADQAIAGNDG
jgi:hypothetical protein